MERVADEAAAHPAHACRNCGAPISGHYCANCGQETRITLPTFGTFMREAAGRYVAFDGRMWRTLWGLVARPGFLTLEYLHGRRRRYIRPARLFLVLYLLLFALIGILQNPSDVANQVVFVNSDEADQAKAAATQEGLAGPAPIAKPQASPAGGNAGPPETRAKGAAATDAKPKGTAAAGADADDDTLVLTNDTFIGLDDALNLTWRVGGVEAKLPEQLRRRYAHFKTLPKAEKAEQIYAGMLRYGTYAMVALLPAFALLLKLAYLGRAARYPGRPRRYAEHLVYSAHLHAFAALILMLLLVLPYGPVKAAVAMWIVYYVMRARQRVYRGRWWAGLIRSTAVAVVYSLLVAVAMFGLLVAAVMLR
jgi:hypothetical protein